MVDKYKLHAEINNRYEMESVESCSLGCGSTFEAMNIKNGEKILDLGCGRGDDTLKAAEQAGQEGWAVGLDLTDAMISEAVKNSTSKKVRNAEFIQGDIERLPFKDLSFDGIMSNCVINHARNKTAVYKEIFRVLKNGGRFVIADAVSKGPLPEDVKNDPEAWAQCFGGAVTEKEYIDAIISAGFYHVDILSRREYIKNGYDFISLTLKAVK